MMYYLFAILDNINILLTVFVIISSIAFTVVVLGSAVTLDYPNGNDHKTFILLLKKNYTYMDYSLHARHVYP